MPSAPRYHVRRQSVQSDTSDHVALDELDSMYSGHSRSRAVSEDMDETDWASRPLVRSSSPDLSWARSRTRGAVGRFLYSTALGWQVYIALLALGLSAAETGATLLNHKVLLTSDWRFGYPVTLTFYQFLATHFILVILATLSRLCLPLLRYAGLEGLAAPCPSPSARSLRPFRRLPDWVNSVLRFLRPLCTIKHGIAGGGLGELDLATVKHMAPLVFAFASKVALANVSLATSALPKYTLARVHSFPITLVLSSIVERSDHSLSTLSSSLTAALNLMIAAWQSGGPGPRDAIIAGIISAVFSGLYPVLLVRTYQNLLRQAASEQDLAHARNSSNAEASQPDTYEPFFSHQSRQEELPTALAHWRMLHYLSLLSTVAIFPVLLLTGEIKDIQDNCYILDTRRFWHPAIGAFFCCLVIFVLLPLFAVATGAPATGFLGVPRQSLQLSVTNPQMPLHSWVGVIMCWLSSLWFVAVQWRKSRVLERLRT